MNLEKLAKLISIVLGPLWLPLLITIILFKTNLSSQQIIILFPSLVILEVLIPLIYIYIAVKRGIISAWDMPKRQERYHFSGVMLLTTILSLFLVYIFGNPFLLSLSIMIFFLLLVISFITLFWKISIHSSLNTLGAILINILFSWQFLWLFLVIPIIFWSRLKLKRHNLAQLVVGMLITILIIILAGSIFNLK